MSSSSTGIAIAIAAAGLLCSGAARAQSLSVTNAQSPAMLWRAGQGLPALPGSPLVTGDALKTGLGGSVVVIVGSGHLDLAGVSELVVEQLPFEDYSPGAPVALRLQRGSARLVLGDERPMQPPLELRLAGQALAIGGGEHIVQLVSGEIRACIASGQAELRTFEGLVRGTLPAGSCYLINETTLVPERNVDWAELRGAFDLASAAPAGRAPDPEPEPEARAQPPPLLFEEPPAQPMPVPPPRGAAPPPEPARPTVSRVWDPSLNREIVTEVRDRVPRPMAAAPARRPPAPESTPPPPAKVATARMPAPSPAEAAAPIAPAGTGAGAGRTWTVIAGSFTDRERAEREKRSLEGRGVPAAVTSKEIKGRTWYRVHAGEHSSQAQAAIAARELSEKLGNPSIWVAPAPH